MSTPTAAPPSRRWRPWRDRTDVERVAWYTRGSLYVLLWLLPGISVLNLNSDRSSAVEWAGLLLLILVTGATGTWLLRRGMDLYPAPAPLPVRPLLALAAIVAIGAGWMALTPEAGVRTAVAWTVGGVAVWSVGSLVDRRVIVGLVVVVCLLALLATGSWGGPVFALAVSAFYVFTVRTSLWLLSVVQELARSRQTEARLAVAEERLRFSRDVHDVLGRQLSAIAVTADLGASLAQRGAPGSVDRMLEVRGLAQQALREARELARGYRPTDLAQELDGARSLLAAAGIATRIDCAGLPAAWEEPAAWVVRESVTNLLRHAEARQVTIAYADGALVVRNDGVRPVGGSAGSTAGQGLAGLRERLLPLGATLEAGPHGPDFVVAARFPAQRLEEARP